MHKGLRQVPSQLALLDVEFLGEQARRTAGRSATLEPARGREEIELADSRRAP